MNSDGTDSSVHVWEEEVSIPTYPVPAPDKNPMFVDKRVYQGSSGKVYPNPFTDRVSDQKVDRRYQAVFLENEYVRLMILPEIGGRIHIGQDKTNNYDFFYRQNVIKPALVGLLGPWISGGVEFNWPQHHRPSTYMPVQHAVENHDDGSKTVWLSEHEPMNRMKGMVGICLHSGKSLVEAKVRLYNRTALVQTFLWWANVGIRVHDQYQAFFPPDVAFVADHAKRAMSWYPVARNDYYGVDYSAGVDISWYKNIPVPTSYMVTQSKHDFMGGYDHAKKAGIVHVADRHIAPGKKLWTWGNAEFGYAWDRELTDQGGPYIELMSGVYTDNQPDFSWLTPYETKMFSQYWYPIQEIGPVKNANTVLAINLEPVETDKWKLGVAGTEALQDARIELSCAGKLLFERRGDILPGKPFVEVIAGLAGIVQTDLRLRVLDERGTERIRYSPEKPTETALPKPATEPPPPAAIKTNEELYLTGLHLEQYRHATCHPEPYWEEALTRDGSDARCNNALGMLALRRGEFQQACLFFERAVERITARNPNPYDGEPYFNLGLALRYLNKEPEAYDAFYKATWNYAWRSGAYYNLAVIDCQRGDFAKALEHVRNSQRTNIDNLQARNLETAILRRLQRTDEACQMATATAGLDALDFWSRNELSLLGKSASQIGRDPQNGLDLALDYADAGMWREADDVLGQFLSDGYPMLFYTRGYIAERQGDAARAAAWYRKGAEASPDYCFPSRLAEMIILESVLRASPNDARAHHYLGNLLYDKGRRELAIGHWERAHDLEPGFSIPARNLGIAYFNVRHDRARALTAYRHAFDANPQDARLLYELDQLRKRSGARPEERLAELEQHLELVDQRDDLTIELVTLYNQTGQSERALKVLEERRFHPWEGGEGLVSGQYVAAHLLLGRSAFQGGVFQDALRHFEAAREYPHNLGEGKHALTRESDIDYFSGLALAGLDRQEEAEQRWGAAARAQSDRNRFGVYGALALRELGDSAAAHSALERLEAEAEKQLHEQVKIDYFATSLPNFLLFDDDLQLVNEVSSLFLRGLARIGLFKTEAGTRDLIKVLDLDKNHLWAAAELKYAASPSREATPAR